MQSWVEYVDELLREGRIDERTRDHIEDGKIQICPICMGLTALSAAHANTEEIAVASTRSFPEWKCGHCGSMLADSTAPLLN